MILYIHGFGSIGVTRKVNMLKTFFLNEKIENPTLNHKPKEDFKLLCNIIENYKEKENILVIGTSLGAFYAYVLSRKYKVPCGLINPSLNPDVTLKKHIGKFKNYNTKEVFNWTEKHLKELTEIKKELFNYEYIPELYNVYLSTDDEELNHKETKKLFPSVIIKEYENQSHRFKDMDILFNDFNKIINGLENRKKRRHSFSSR